MAKRKTASKRGKTPYQASEYLIVAIAVAAAVTILWLVLSLL